MSSAKIEPVGLDGLPEEELLRDTFALLKNMGREGLHGRLPLPPWVNNEGNGIAPESHTPALGLEQLPRWMDRLHADADRQPGLAVLLVAADSVVRGTVRAQLSAPDLWVREAQSGTDALEKLMESPADVMVLSPQLPDLDVAEFQSIVRLQFPQLQVLALTPQSEKTGRLQSGPVAPSKIAPEAAPIVSTPLSRSRRDLSGSTQQSWHGLVGAAPGMQRVYHAARLVARRDTTVLIQGESGTGKDVLARGIHAASPRDKQPFIVINCAAIPDTLLEAELFGHAKGAFTGATQSRLGRVHAAHGGTLFLDEIGEMPVALQSKILRFLEQGEVQRIGGTDTLKVDCRVIAATNADLKRMVKTSQFREDLYYRLAIFPIQLPPLRERTEDLDALIEALLARFCPGMTVHSAARALLLAHDWPGNVRELRNVLERATLFADGRREIHAEDIVL